MWDSAYYLGLFCLSLGFANLTTNLRIHSLVRGKHWLIGIFLVSTLWCSALLGQGILQNQQFSMIALSCQILHPALLAVYLQKSRNLKHHLTMLIAILLPSAFALGAVWHTQIPQLLALAGLIPLQSNLQALQLGIWMWILGLGLWNLHLLRPWRKPISLETLWLSAAIAAPSLAQALEFSLGTETPNPHPWASLGLGISLVCLWFFPSKKHIHGIGPLSRNSVMDQLDMGVAILSPAGRIMDCTPMARKILAQLTEGHGLKSGPLHQRLDWLPDLNLLEGEIHGQIERCHQSYEYQVQPIFSALQEHEGWILSLRDISSECAERKILKDLAYTDALTGLANRNNFLQTLENEIQRFQRYGQSFALLLMDLDHFKKINDTYGHLAGDECLRHFSRLSQQFLREVDVIGRLGGEEFAALLPLADSNSAYAAAERLRRQIEQNTIWFEGKEIKLTVSIGLARPILGDDTPEHILSRADQALYSAKHHGRNTTQVCQESRAQDGHQDDLQIPMALS